jgi:ribosome biogenesis GTPase
MGRLTKRQQKRINYFLREKAELKKKREMIHEESVPKFIDKHLPYVRKLAKNLDQLVIVSSFVSPPMKTGLIDRFLVLAEIENLPVIICLNKTDLLEDQSESNSIVKLYKDIGYEVLETSVKEHIGIELLHQKMNQKRTAFAGHSGVGKSSLLNAIQPDLEINVNDVSRFSNKGKHTTTKVKIYMLDRNTEVIDLPGIKLIDFVDIHKTEARRYFKEFLAYADNCKFRDCNHLSEHNCAVKNAVQKGLIDERRYDSYCSFVESLQ